MSTVTGALSSRPVLADVLPRPSKRTNAIAANVALVLGGAILVSLLAQVTIELPLVPITGQTLRVVLVGAALGAKRGAMALTTYMLMGLAGLPVFAGFEGSIASLGSPSFGFVVGFIPAAFLAGWFAQRRWDRKPWLAMIGFVAASIVPFLIGVPYMTFILNSVMGLGMDFGGIMAAGVTPFIAGGLIKAAIAALLIPLAWRAVRSFDQRVNDQN